MQAEEHKHRTARVVDTRLEASSENEVTYVVEEGAQTQLFVPLTSSSHSTQNTTFNLNNIADKTCRDSRMVLAMTVTATLQVTNSDTSAHTLINGDNFGFKQWPLNRCVQSVQHQINQASYTLQTAQYLDSIAKLNAYPQDMNFYENSQPDLIDSYAAASGSELTPLASYTSTIAGDGVNKPRTLSYTVSGNSIAASSTSAVVITATLYEPLITPFNNVSSKMARGLYAITGEIITLNWVSDLFNRMFALATPQFLTVSSPVVSLGSSATLDLIYLTPQASYLPDIPHSSVYPYNDYTNFTNNLGPCAAGAILSGQTTQVCNFTNIPQKILIYAKLADSAQTCATPDKYLKIRNISCTFNNGNPVLNNATTRQLYDISKRNGLQIPAAAFQQLCLNRSLVAASGATPLYGCGSVLVLDPAIDLGLQYDSASGSAGRYIFQATMDLENGTDTAFPGVTLYVIAITSGILERRGSEYRNKLLTLPTDVLAEARMLPAVDYTTYTEAKHSNAFMTGGGIGDWFRKAASRAYDAIKWGVKHKDEIKDVVDSASKVVKSAKGGKGGAAMKLFYE